MTDLSGCTIAFDLDGTLVDTAPDLHTALNAVLATEGLPPASLEDMRKFVGQGARVLLVRAFGVHNLHPDDAKLDALTEAYVETYAQDICRFSKPYPGLIEALDQLEALGVIFCVCTNKRTGLSRQLLDALNLSHRFKAIVGADSVPRKKPDPAHFIAAVRAAGGDPAQSLMIGDSIADVGAAKAAGRPVAVVSFGYTDTAPELLGADAVFTHYAELTDLAVTLLGRQPTPRR